MHFVSLPPLSGQLLRYSFSAQLVLGHPTWKSRCTRRVTWCFCVAHSGPLARMALLLLHPLFLTLDALGLHHPNKALALNPCLRLCIPRQAKTMNIMLRELHMRRYGNNSSVKYGHNFIYLFIYFIPDPGIKPAPLISPALAGRFFTSSAAWECQIFEQQFYVFAINSTTCL